MPACVVTGGTGNVGHALVESLLAAGRRVYVVCNPTSRRLDWLPQSPDCHILRLGLAQLTDAVRFIEEPCDQFFHLGWEASYGPRREEPYGQVRNVFFTLDAVELAYKLGCKVFVGAGSQAQYGDTDVMLTEDTPLRPSTYYGQVKCCVEGMSRVRCRELGLRHVWARIVSVYGPCDGPFTLVSYLMSCWLRREPAEVTPGAQQWDFLYAGDAATALMALAERGHDGQAYCLASGTARPLRSYLEDWKAVGGERAVLRMTRPYPQGARMCLCADISRLRADTGFSPATEFMDGMRRTLEWYMAHPNAVAL